MMTRLEMLAREREDLLRPAADLREDLAKLRRKTKVDEDRRMICGIATALFLLVATPALWVGKSYLEAKAFNRITGKDATTTEAMFVELRVQ